MNHKEGLAIFLSIACTVILGSVFLLGKSPECTFTPGVTESVFSNSWGERNPQTDSGHAVSRESTDETLPENSSAEDPVQTVISEDIKQVITELTPIEDRVQMQTSAKPTVPLPDREKQGRLPKCDMLPNAQTSVPKSTPEESPQRSSKNASQGQDGQVYDPIFGWVVPSTSQGQAIDNDGNINKQVEMMD